MKYYFKDWNNKEILMNTAVMFITGPYSIFNNALVDEIKEMCKGKIEEISNDEVEELLDEFSGFDANEESGSNNLSFDEFMELSNVQPMDGKWFCSVDYKTLTKKQKERLDKYIKKPSTNGVLVIVSYEWEDYKGLLRSKVIANSGLTHLVQLSFPSRRALKEIVIELFKSRGIDVADNAVDLFIMRMSSAYDEYKETIDTIISCSNGKSISYEQIKESMHGIENYVLDDFLQQLLKPMTSKKVCKNRKIYKMLDSLVDSMGYKKLVSKLYYKIEDMIEFRININNGNIPVMARYSTKEIQNRLDENSKLKKMSSKAFKRSAYVASMTSLRDWYYMKLMLKNIDVRQREEDYARVIMAVIHRKVLSNSRIINDIGISNIMDEGLFDLNRIFYNPYVKAYDSKVNIGNDTVDYETGEIVEHIEEEINDADINAALIMKLMEGE